MYRWRLTLLCNDNDSAYFGSEDSCQMPDMVYRRVLQEVRAFPGSIGTRQHRVRKHQADPTAGANNLQRTTKEEQVAICLPVLLR